MQRRSPRRSTPHTPTSSGSRRPCSSGLKPQQTAQATPATTVAYDYVQILVDALHVRGLDYEPVSVGTGFDVELTGVFATGPMDIRLTDREVILVRHGTHRPTVTWSNAQHGQYAAQISVPTPFPGLSFPLPWAWASIDATGRERLNETVSELEGRGVTVLLKGIRPEHRRALDSAGAIEHLASEHHIFDTLDAAITHARLHVDAASRPSDPRPTLDHRQVIAVTVRYTRETSVTDATRLSTGAAFRTRNAHR